MNGNGHFPEAAKRMARSVEESRWGHNSSRLTIYFTDAGRRISPAGRAAMNGSSAWTPSSFVFAVEYPFSPGLPSCADMVRDFLEGICPVVYDEARWECDVRITEAAGASVLAEARASYEARQTSRSGA